MREAGRQALWNNRWQTQWVNVFWKGTEAGALTFFKFKRGIVIFMLSFKLQVGFRCAFGHLDTKRPFLINKIDLMQLLNQKSVFLWTVI